MMMDSKGDMILDESAPGVAEPRSIYIDYSSSLIKSSLYRVG